MAAATLRLRRSFPSRIDIDVSGAVDRIFQRSPLLAGMHLPLRARDGRESSKVKQKMSYVGMPRKRRRSVKIVGMREKKKPEASRARATGGS